MATILICLFLAIVVGKALGSLCEKAGLPAVLGEIFAGILLGNLTLAFPQIATFREFSQSEFLHHLSEIGVVLLLFSVGLESNVKEVVKVGFNALTVAIVGVVAPMAITYGLWKAGFVDDRLPSGMSSPSVVLFTAATLAATSVGITARVLSQAKKLTSRTGQVILNAAVIDDVLGLLVLSGVSAFVASGRIDASTLSGIMGRALIFFAVATTAGLLVFPALLRSFKKSILALALCVCFLYAWFGAVLGLAPIVGAFLAGLFLDDKTDAAKHAIEPIVQFLSPLFFVLIGAQIRIDALAGSSWGTLKEVAVVTVAAIIGKLFCGLASGKNTDRVAVGLGMAPRGEVGLIFAMTGKQMGVLSDHIFAALVFVVLLTTLLPTIALGWWLKRSAR